MSLLDTMFRGMSEREQREAVALAPPDAGRILDIYLSEVYAVRDAERNARRALEGKTQDTWYASSLADCYRSQYLARLGRERTRELDAQAYRNFAWGDHVEDFLRLVYTRCGLVADTQVSYGAGSLWGRLDLLLRYPPRDVFDEVRQEKWSPEWESMIRMIRSRIDDLGPWYDDDHGNFGFAGYDGLVGTEIKSAKSSAMKYMYRDGARDNHLIQVGAYMVTAEAMRDAGQLVEVPDFWQIEYVGKDAVGVLRFRVTDEHATRALARWQFLDSVWDAQPDPMDVPCECEGWRVQYCRYANDTGTCCFNKWTDEKGGE